MLDQKVLRSSTESASETIASIAGPDRPITAVDERQVLGNRARRKLKNHSNGKVALTETRISQMNYSRLLSEHALA